MDIDRNRVRRIFDEAAELPKAERGAFLDRECAGDPALRREVEDLLGSLDAADEFLPPSSPEIPGGGSLRESAGSRIGPYKLLQPIGEGGFGTVFLAEQQTPVVRRVALKIIKLGMDTKQVIARFEAERQALALMDHPGIAKVLDAGATETGRPYFVMELVRGEPITAYCDKNHLDMQDRLALFVDICHAIQHAHQKGIVHRDIKPTNILVTVADGRAIPKVIDFGVAKATISRLTEKTLFTEHRQLIGTPEYMSPEQAEMNAVDIDTRSDIYSLGVLLYELLTGTTPVDARELRSAAFHEMQRMIREVDPPKPSTRISTLGEEVSGIASRRQTEPAKLTRIVRGDLDWIVMKALEKERARRYESASGLARDIESHLQHEPVVAGPPGRVYRMSKFVRRNRASVLAAALVLAALVLGVIGTTAGMLRANAARRSESDQRKAAQEHAAKAEAEATRAKTVLAVMNDMLQAPPPVAADADPTIHEGSPGAFSERLNAFAQAWGLADVDDPAVEVEVRGMLGRTLRSSGMRAAAAKQFGRVVELRRQLAGELDPSLDAALREQVEAVSSGGDRPGAVLIAKDAVERARATRLEDSEIAERLHLLADALAWARDFEAAETASKEALALRSRSTRRHVRVADNLSQLGGIAMGRKHWEEALAHYREAAALQRDLQGQMHASTWTAEQRIIDIAGRNLDFGGAVEAARDATERARRAISPAAPLSERLLLAKRMLLLVGSLQRTPDGAEEAYRLAKELLEIQREVPDDPEQLSHRLYLLGNTAWVVGRLEEAEASLREAIAVARTRGDLGFNLAGAESQLAVILRDGVDDPSDARLAEAEALARSSLEYSSVHNLSAPWASWVIGLDLAMIRRLRGDEAEAKKLEKEAAAIGPRNLFLSIRIATRCEVLAERWAALGEHATAEPLFSAREYILRFLSPEHWSRFDAMSALGACLGALGRFAEGEPQLLESSERLRADRAVPPANLRRALGRTAEFYAAWDAAEPGRGHDARAEEWRGSLAEHDAAHAGETKPR